MLLPSGDQMPKQTLPSMGEPLSFRNSPVLGIGLESLERHLPAGADRGQPQPDDVAASRLRGVGRRGAVAQCIECALSRSDMAGKLNRDCLPHPANVVDVNIAPTRAIPAYVMIFIFPLCCGGFVMLSRFR